MFDRGNSHKEIWCLASAFDKFDFDMVTQPPDQAQWEASDRAALAHAGSDTKGHFVPWALIRDAHIHANAFRFIWPTLLVTSTSTVQTWGLPSCEITLQIAEQIPTEDFSVNYVDVCQRHIYIAGNSLMVFCRQSGSCLLQIGSSYVSNYSLQLATREWPPRSGSEQRALASQSIDRKALDTKSLSNLRIPQNEEFHSGKLVVHKQIIVRI